MIKLVVPAGQDANTIKNCILDMLPQLRVSEAEKLLKKGDIKINGKRTKKDVPVYDGDTLEIYLNAEYEDMLPDSEIVYEDTNIIIYNKQPGISCVSDKDDGKPTIATLAEEYMRKIGAFNEQALMVPFVVHRLDHNTGGLVIVAKSQDVYELFVQAFKERRVKKYYRAIICGAPDKDAGELVDYIIKDAGAARVRVVHQPNRAGLPAVTRYRVLRRCRDLSLVELELVTGRTHQARAHMASIGCPILGDDKYGNRRMNKKYGARYQALWAYKIVFETGKENPLDYLNEKVVETDHIDFPYIEEMENGER